jgi:hypothetical protein
MSSSSSEPTPSTSFPSPTTTRSTRRNSRTELSSVRSRPSRAGDTCNGTFDLEPGDYVLFCNLVHEEEGEIENHFQLGMRTEFTVE